MSGIALADLIAIFDATFSMERTVLRAGFAEPEYIPWCENQPAEIRFRADYFSSALHEIAHWCIAGRRRRQLPDFGYWYAPDGRDAEQQAQFEHVEVRPQAVEWHLHAACRRVFHLSFDNLGASTGDGRGFAVAVHGEALRLQRSLPPRAARLVAALGGGHLKPTLAALGYPEAAHKGE
ncbi:MAG: elongation factor P hydroxylase [Planctomycetota bacterium]|nr:elongation factor P hydroxylase [Planctomycetota bacterium]